MEPLLVSTLPPQLETVMVKGFRPLPGIRNLAWRSLRALARAGDSLLSQRPFDMVFFSTTQFTTFTLGPRWKRKFGVPFVCDLQDPWVNSFYDKHPEAPRPGGWKHHVAQFIAKYLERKTLPSAAGLLSVSSDYLREIDERLPSVRALPRITLPFGADELDWQGTEDPSAAQSIFKPHDLALNLVSVGRGGADLQPSVTALAAVLSFATNDKNDPIKRLPHLHLIGTSYAANAQAKSQFNLPSYLASWVTEHPSRVGFYTALRCLRDADIVVILGSRDLGYQPSKLYIAASSGRPVLAIVLPNSGLAQAVRKHPVDHVICLDNEGGISAQERLKASNWLREPLFHSRVSSVKPRSIPPEFHARGLTQQQTTFFDQVTSPHS